jgi:hypothetical protein
VARIWETPAWKKFLHHRAVVRDAVNVISQKIDGAQESLEVSPI